MAVEDTSTLQAALKNTLVLDKGTGNPSFARTTTATCFDNLGKLITLPSGVARFPGARNVTNMIVNSTDYSDSSWLKETGVSVSGTNNVTFPTGTFGANRLRTDAIPHPDGERANSKLLTTVVFPPSSAWSDDTATIRVAHSTGTAVAVTATASEQTIVQIRNETVSGTSSVVTMYSDKPVTITGLGRAQLEIITGDSDETAREEVSKAVLSNPWHGAGADGSKWFTTDVGGSAISDATLKRLLVEPAATNQVLWCRDGTNAAWSKTNITPTKDQVGIDGKANSATRLTATAANGTCLQTITLSAATRSTSFFVKRITGTGTIEITRNGGTNWTDITSSINSSTYTRVGIKATSVTNPSIGFRIVTSGDAIAFDYAQDEAGSVFTSPILTTTATATRNADQLSYQTTSNISDTAGAISAKVERDDWTDAGGTIGNGTTTGLALSSSNSGVQALDGTNTVNGPSGTPTSQEQLAIGWSGSTLKAASGGTIGTSGSYDGSFNLSVIAVEAKGNIADLNIWTSALTDAQLQEASGATATVINIGQSAETNLAQAFSFSKILAVSQAAETDAATSFNASKIYSIAASAETDIANSFDKFKNLSISQSLETDTSQTFTVAKQLIIAQLSEIDTSQEFGIVRIYGLVQSSESDSSNVFDFAKQVTLNQSSETDIANIFTSNAPIVLSQVSENDVANQFSISKLVSMSQSAETDSATVNNILKSVTVIQGTETDSSTQFAISKSLLLPQAAETDVATQLSSSSLISIDQAAETDIATVAQESKSLAIVQTSESDTAAVLNKLKTLWIFQSGETNTSQPFSINFTIDILTANESDSATVANFKKSLQIVAAIESDNANVITSPTIPKALIALGVASGIYNIPAVAGIYDKQITAKLN